MRKMSKITKFLVFTITVIILATIVYTVLQTIFPEIDYIQYYVAFVGIFGAPEILGCVVIKCFNIKKGE